MGQYESELTSLVKDEIFSAVEGDKGILAVTSKEVILLESSQVQRAELALVRKVTRGDGGNIFIMGDEAPLIKIPLQGFQIDELKVFFESLKLYASRAREGIAPPKEAVSKPEGDEQIPPMSPPAQPSLYTQDLPEEPGVVQEVHTPSISQPKAPSPLPRLLSIIVIVLTAVLILVPIGMVQLLWTLSVGLGVALILWRHTER